MIAVIHNLQNCSRAKKQQSLKKKCLGKYSKFQYYSQKMYYPIPVSFVSNFSLITLTKRIINVYQSNSALFQSFGR